MKKLFLSFTFLIFSLTLLAQSEQEKKAEEVYTKDFLIKFAQALYTEKENPKQALQMYEELYAQAPQDSTLLKSLATLCAKTDNKTCAHKYIPLYLKAAPQDSQALALSAHLAWQKGKLQEAREYYAAALKNDPQNPQILMQYLALLSTVDKEEAITFLRQLEQENNLLYIPINLEIAQIYLNQNQPKEAVSVLDQAIKKYPQTREFYLAKIKIYEIQNNLPEVYKVYFDMDKEGILDDNDLVKIGGYYVLQNKPQEALKYYQRAYLQNPQNARACDFLSAWEQSQKHFLQAANYLTQSEDFKTNPALRLRQVHLLKLAGAPDKALLAMQQAHQDFNDSLEIGFYYALMLEDNNQYKKAAALLEKLLLKQPDNEEILLNYVYTLSKLKDYKKMQKVLQQVITRNPKNAEALNFLGYYFVDRTKQLEKGGDYIKQALEINPKDSATLDSLAWYFYKKGKAADALKLLEALPQKDKQDPEITWHLAKVYEALGENQKAIFHYEKLLNSDEYGAQAKKSIKKIDKK